MVRARAALPARGEVAVDGVLARDFRELDATTRLKRVELGPWRRLAGLATGWQGDLSFDGRLHAQLREGAPVTSLTGAAVLANVSITGPTGSRADRIAFEVRRLQWPEASETPEAQGLPLPVLLSVLEDVSRAALEPPPSSAPMAPASAATPVQLDSTSVSASIVHSP
jgi:hypothetical protein